MSDEASDDPWAGVPLAKSQPEADPWAGVPLAKPEGASAPAIAPKAADVKPADETALAAPPSAIARASLATTPEAQIERYAEHFRQPPSDFWTEDGRIVRRVPETGGVAYVEPSLLGGSGVGERAKRAVSTVAGAAGPAITAAAGMAGTAAGAPWGGVGAIPGGLAGGAAGDYLRQSLDRWMTSDPKGETDWGSVAVGAAEGAANHPVAKTMTWIGRAIRTMPGIKPILDKVFSTAEETGQNLLGLSKQARDAVVEYLNKNAAEIAQVTQAGKDLGLDLTLGQRTGSKLIQMLERKGATLPEGAERFAERRRFQNETAIPKAVRSTLDDIAPQQGGEAAVQGFRSAAGDVTEEALKQRGAQASKVYSKALDERTDRFWNEDVDQLMRRPSMQGAIGYAKKIAAEEGKDLTVPVYENGKLVGRDVVPDWRSWDYIKQGVDAVIESEKNDLGKLSPYGRVADRTRRELLGHLDKANPDYAKARATYGSASDTVNMILDGGVGFINRMSGPDRQNMVSRVFSGTNLLPEEITRMRNQFLRAGKINEWNGGIRNYVEQQLSNAMDPRGGVAHNVGDKLYRGLFYGPEGDVLKAAIGDHRILQKWSTLGDALKGAARQLPEGSSTGANLALEEPFGAKAVALAKAASPKHWVNAPAEITEGIVKLREPAARKQLVDYLLTDQGERALRSMPIKITPANQARTNAVLGGILVNAGVAGGRQLMPSDDGG